MAKPKNKTRIYKTGKKLEFKLKGKCDNCKAIDYLQCANIFSNWVCDTCHVEMARDLNTFKDAFQIEVVAIVKNRRRYSKTKNIVVLTISEAIKKLEKGKALKVTSLTVPEKCGNTRYKNRQLIYRASMLAGREISCRFDKNGTPIVICKK
jgi:hypothetical protein